METDSVFWQLLKYLPETLFDLLGLPLSRAADYRFDAVELKKSYRLDGLLLPSKPGLPVYFVEFQFRRSRHFYANLFAKVFTYLEKNNPDQDWLAVALFDKRSTEPKNQPAYRDLLNSPRVRRFYADKLEVSAQATPGLKILQLVSAPITEAQILVDSILRKPDCEPPKVIVELVEEVLIRRFNKMTREEIRKMFKLHDIRKTRVWEEGHEEGREEGREEGSEETKREVVSHLQKQGKSLKEIADLLAWPIAEVRRLAK